MHGSPQESFHLPKAVYLIVFCLVLGHIILSGKEAAGVDATGAVFEEDKTLDTALGTYILTFLPPASLSS